MAHLSRRHLLLGLVPALLVAPPGFAALLRPASPALDVPLCRGGLSRISETPANTPDNGTAAAEADYLEKLGLLEGHLLVGRRLLDAGQSRLAVPHFGHPIRELYTWLEPRLARRGAPQMERELEAMEAWAEGGNTGTGGAFAAAWTSLAPKLAAAKAAVPAALRTRPGFVLGHVAMILFDVASDYGESIERGRIVNVVEYHDSMGYLMYAATTAAAGRDAATGPARDAFEEVIALMEGLRQRVYPETLPPARPPASISWVRGHYDRARSIAERVAA